MKALATVSLVAVIGVGTFVASGLAGDRPGVTMQTPTVSPTSQVLEPYGFETLLKAGVPAKIAMTDGFAFTWCLNVTQTGPGQWSVNGTCDIGPGCNCQFWNATGTITQVGHGFNINWTAVNCASDGCAACSDCFTYTGTWTRATGSGGWSSFCDPVNCNQIITSGTWNGVITPPQC